MMEMFSDWMPSTGTITRIENTKNAVGQTVKTPVNIDGTHTFAKWVSSSRQTNISDKNVDKEIGKLAIDFKKFYITTVVISPPSSTTVEVFPDITWYVTINSVKYFIDGIDNIGSLGEVYLFTYTRDRT